MNKNILIVLLLILLLLAGYYLFGREVETGVDNIDVEEVIVEDEDEEPEENVEASDRTEVRERLSRMTVDVPDVDSFATLSSGEAAFDAGAGVEGYMTLGEAYTLVSNGEAEFALVHATISTGGSGTFDYVFAVEVADDTLTHTGSAYLGDRIIVEEIEAGPQANGGFDVSVVILTRVEGEPLSALPTVPLTLDFSLSAEGEFGE